MQQFGKILVIIGTLAIVAGLILWLLPGKFGWLGHLPGDIRIKRENFQFFFPITTMILLSTLLTLILWIVRKFLK